MFHVDRAPLGGILDPLKSDLGQNGLPPALATLEQRGVPTATAS